MYCYKMSFFVKSCWFMSLSIVLLSRWNQFIQYILVWSMLQLNGSFWNQSYSFIWAWSRMKTLLDSFIPFRLQKLIFFPIQYRMQFIFVSNLYSTKWTQMHTTVMQCYLIFQMIFIHPNQIYAKTIVNSVFK